MRPLLRTKRCCVTSDTENYKALYENATVEIQMFLNKIEEEKETIFFSLLISCLSSNLFIFVKINP